MSTIRYFDQSNFKKINKTPMRTTIESAFYGNNVVQVDDRTQAYNLAKNAHGAVVLDGLPVYKPEEQGIPSDACVVLFNDGAVFGRTAAARRIIGYPNVNVQNLATIVREAIFNIKDRRMYKADAYIGLEEDFMVQAHALIPEGYEANLYSWMLNFQYINDEYKAMYSRSRQISENDGDIYIFADPEWTHPDYPYGLAIFSPEENCAAVLGLRYFGEMKKGTLTLGWGIAARNGYASCHGGIKRYEMQNGEKFVLAAFGLSGSGKSTITHAKHGDKYDITVLHDDAFVVNVKERYAIALEPAYFDKVQDYPWGCEDNKFLLTMQNVGVTLDESGKKIPVTEDLRNGNGRAVKSRLWTPNRIDRIDEPLNAICWLMRDPTIPPILKITDPSLAAALGATLATVRTSAERLVGGVDPNALVFEPYANPFRTYPLSMDYEKFRELLEDGVDCYILNTGSFMGTKVKPQHTLEGLEAIVENRAEFVPLGDIQCLEYMPIKGFDVDPFNMIYRRELLKRFKDRLDYITSLATINGGMDNLPMDAYLSINQTYEEISEGVED